MNRFASIIAVLAAAILATGVSLAEEKVLYWMVDDTATVDVHGANPVNIQDYLTSTYIEEPATYYAARIRVTPDGGEDIFLPLYAGGATFSGGIGVEFWDNGAGWGAGVPTGNQSPLGIYASPEYSFTVEIGNVMWSDIDGPSWVETVATSASASYTELVTAKYIADSFDTEPPAGQIWTPTSFTAVPEPSSGLLVLVGGALLELRRRRKGEA